MKKDTSKKNTASSKTEYYSGDLYYGYSEVRYVGMQKNGEDLGNEQLRLRKSTPQDPLTVDHLNLFSGVSDKIKKGKDKVKNYFEFISYLENNTFTDQTSLPNRWLAYLKEHIDQLKLDKEIEQMRSGYLAVEPTKDRFHKNISTQNNNSEDGLKSAIIGAYTKKEILPYTPPQSLVQKLQNALQGNTKPNPKNRHPHRGLINEWLTTAFFRKTSKLGIDFAIKEGNVIHFNTFSSYSYSPDKSITHEAEHPVKDQKQPITHSELRKINRTYGHNHPQVDLYWFDPKEWYQPSNTMNTNIQRKESMGEMKDYKAKKTRPKRNNSSKKL